MRKKGDDITHHPLFIKGLFMQIAVQTLHYKFTQWVCILIMKSEYFKI